MTSLRQHFEYIKAIVDWSWTLAILVLIGYITLGQLVQLYWAMIFFGGLAASFGAFYNFSCKKLKELNSLDTYELQIAYAKAEAAQRILTKFARRNPEIAQNPDFIQAKEKVNNIKTKSNEVYKTKNTSQSPKRSTSQSPTQPAEKHQNTSQSFLEKERKKFGETKGHPPYQYNLKTPPPGYPIKVTKTLKGEKHKGIYYLPDDPEYPKHNAHWWFENEEAVPKHIYRESKRRNKRRRKK